MCLLKYTLAFYQDLKNIFYFILLLQLSAPYCWAVWPVSKQKVMIMPAYLQMEASWHLFPDKQGYFQSLFIYLQENQDNQILCINILAFICFFGPPLWSDSPVILGSDWDTLDMRRRKEGRLETIQLRQECRKNAQTTFSVYHHDVTQCCQH